MESILEAALMEHIRRLCVEIGPRPIGSQANHSAADYIRGVFQAAGLDVVDQTFPCPDWQDQETRLDLDGELLMARANTYSPSTDVRAPGIALGSIAELERSDLRGRIGVLYGDLSRSPLTPKGCTIYENERDQGINRLLEQKRPVALITVSPRVGSVERLIEDWSLEIPSATVPAEVGLVLLERIGWPLHLRIVTRRVPGYSANIVARRIGAGMNRIVLCAHYDTKVDTPGASDDAAGISALLSLAGSLPDKYPNVGLEFIAFSAEEYGASEDDTEYYVRCCGDEMGNIVAAINMDLLGQRLGTTLVSIMAGSEGLRSSVDALLAERPSVMWTEPWPQSSHSTFALRGVPAIAISCRGIANIVHEPADTIDVISGEKLGEVVELASAIVGVLQDKPLCWTRETCTDRS